MLTAALLTVSVVPTVSAAEDPTVEISTDEVEAESDSATTPTTPLAPSTPDEPCDDQPEIQPDVWENPYKDVAMSHWFYSAVKYASENDIMQGVSDDTFDPHGDITRSMFVTVLYRIEGQPASDESPFTDVESGSWYEAAVSWASANGIVNGTTDTTFSPDATVTREQMATIIYRYATYKQYDMTTTQTRLFTDDEDIADYAREPINWAAEKGLITDAGKGNVTPKANATRAQAAAILQRMVEKLG